MEIGTISNGSIFKLSRYDNACELGKVIERAENLGFLSIQGKFCKNKIHCYKITIYMLFQDGNEKELIQNKDQMVNQIIKCNPDRYFGDLEIDQILFGRKVNLDNFLSNYMQPDIGPSYFYYYKPALTTM